jgi:hypothetical protein
MASRLGYIPNKLVDLLALHMKGYGYVVSGDLYEAWRHGSNKQKCRRSTDFLERYHAEFGLRPFETKSGIVVYARRMTHIPKKVLNW